MSKPSIVAVGMFDGVHAGHRHILSRLRSLADRLDYAAAVVTFVNHPLSLICPDREPPLISETNDRIEKMLELGVDDVLALVFDDQLRHLTVGEFAKLILIPQLNAKAVLLGYDNNFGHDHPKDLEGYRQILEPMGIEVYGCDEFPDYRVSSTMIRKLLSEGKIEDANRKLGHPYVISGEVVKGRQLGRTLGFPTANIVPDGPVALREGVYAAQVVAPENLEGLPAMLNIGTAPTVNGDAENKVTVEAHIIATPWHDLDLYGLDVAVAPIKRLRDEHRYPTLDALRAALDADRQATLDALSTL